MAPRSRRAVLIVAGIVLLGSCGPSQRERDQRAWRQAEALWQRGEHGAAFHAWKSLRPASPQGKEAQRRLQDADRHYRNAVELFSADRPGVREAMVAAMGLGPMDPALYLPLARACRDRGMLWRAADLYRKYLAQQPLPTDAPVARAELEALQGDGNPFPPAFEPRPDERPAASTVDEPWSMVRLFLAGFAVLLGALGLWRWRVGRRSHSLRDLVLDRPELHQTVAYQIGCLRHEFLKHRVGAVAEALRAVARGQATPEQRRFMEERLRHGEPLLVAWRTHLASLQRSLGLPVSLERSDPLFREAGRALAVLARAATPGRSAQADRLADAQATLARLDRNLTDLVGELARCRVDQAFLREIVESTRSEWASGRVQIDELDVRPVPEAIDVDVYRTDLRIVLRNVIRNAIQALDRSAVPRRLAVDVQVQLEPTGEEAVRLRVQDSSHEGIAPNKAGASTVEHGLGIVGAALQRYDGTLEVAAADAGYAKAVVIRLFRSQRGASDEAVVGEAA